MSKRVYNFNPGPATLPLPVLEKCKDEFLDYKGIGMSIVEMSHRSPEFEEILKGTQDLLKELFGIPDNYKILFLGGGASLQFAMIPMNFIPAGGSADYIVTGSWAKKAFKEAQIIAKGNAVATSEDANFNYIPSPDKFKFDPNAAYVHVTSNNTIFGTQWHTYPDPHGKPLVCDMSSDILSRKVDVSKFAMIYGGAQKNLGPAGVTLIILRDDFAATAKSGIPTMLSYATHIKENSLFNTPPVFSIYMVRLVLEWVQKEGGLAVIEKNNRTKAEMVYKTMDESEGYYRGTAEKNSRSMMNLTMRLPSEDLEKKFLSEAKENLLYGLKGHRSVGGIRASMYNYLPLKGVEKLVEFMEKFRKKN